ncbi:MAG: hypothetical protein JWR36_2043 [Glaciihabitans sp.]|jgi:hypothetical protein|nr:hypothetical protein [Glaciihabitans sp.]MDQ1571992.1 hypothetical protein [Actinomycetota bacterium]
MTEQFVIFIVEPEWDPATVTEEDWGKAMQAHAAFSQAVTEAGAEILGGDALSGQKSAVRIDPARDGSPAVFTDGPFGETKEVVTGFYKIGAKDTAQARELAALCPTDGWIELYPVLDTSGS